MRTLIGSALLCLSAAGSATAQDNVLSDTTRMMYGVMSQQMLLASAEKMPEQAYAFKPTDAVRTYGQIVGHLADMQYVFCSVALGEKNPAPRVEQTRTSKADLIAALEEAVAYCDRAYGVHDGRERVATGEDGARRSAPRQRAQHQHGTLRVALREPGDVHANERHLDRAAR